MLSPQPLLTSPCALSSFLPVPPRPALLLRVLLPPAEEGVERDCARLDREDRVPGVRAGKPAGVRAWELLSRVMVTAKLAGKAETGWLYAPSTCASPESASINQSHGARELRVPA